MVHLLFHVSILRKCVDDPNSIVPLNNISVEVNFTYGEVPIEIIDQQVKNLRNK